MAQRKSNQQSQSGRSGQPGAKSGSQKQGTGTSRKSTMKEDEREESSTRGGMNK